MPEPLAPSDALAAILDELRALRAAVEAGEPEGLDAAAAAALLGISRSKLHSLDGAGLLPKRIEIGTGACPRWCRSELIAWLRSGAPARSKWMLMREQTMRRAG